MSRDNLPPLSSPKCLAPLAVPHLPGSHFGRIASQVALMLMALMALAILPGCGNKGPPSPPRQRGPAPIMDLKAFARGGVVHLYFKLPSQNIDGTPFRDLTRVEVFRRRMPDSLDEGGDSLFGGLFGNDETKAKCIMRLQRVELVPGKNLLGRSVHLVDTGEGFTKPEDWFARVFEYYVFTHGKRWRESPPSNLTRARPLLGPKAPEQVGTQAGDSVVKVSWEPQTLMTDGAPIKAEIFYNVYRVPASGWALVGPLNELLLVENHYLDSDVTNDSQYRYTVTTVVTYGELFAESATSATVSATPQDRIAPAAPYGLEAVGARGAVNLLWSADETPDLLGFNVYRKKSGEKAFGLLTPEPIISTTFIDEAVFPEVEYYYCVTAVDRSSFKNESEPTNIVAAKPR